MKLLSISFLSSLIFSFVWAVNSKAAPLPLVSKGPQDSPVLRFSEDNQYYVGWFDTKSGLPTGEVRPVVICPAGDWAPVFSFVTHPGQCTQAIWNASSTCCIISDQPDNAIATVWMVQKEKAEKWSARILEPFTALEPEFRKTDPQVHHLFRSSIKKLEWVSDSKIRFHAFCNLGTYLIDIDTSSPDKQPEIQKLSD